MDSDISGIIQISQINIRLKKTNLYDSFRGITYAKRFIGIKIKQE